MRQLQPIDAAQAERGGRPIIGYRTNATNDRLRRQGIEAGRNSFHVLGRAADLQTDGVPPPRAAALGSLVTLREPAFMRPLRGSDTGQSTVLCHGVALPLQRQARLGWIVCVDLGLFRQGQDQAVRRRRDAPSDAGLGFGGERPPPRPAAPSARRGGPPRRRAIWAFRQPLDPGGARPSPHHVLPGAVAIGDDQLEPAKVLQRADFLCGGGGMPHPRSANHVSASAHQLDQQYSSRRLKGEVDVGE